jgi:hypothetical protein
VAVAGAAFAIAMGPSILPDGDNDSHPTGPAERSESPRPDRPKHSEVEPDRPGDGFAYYEQRHLLFTVARDHLDPAGEHLSMHPNYQSSGRSIGTKLNWKVPGEPGLGMVQVGIEPPGMTDSGRRFEIGCDEYFSCERRELADGSSAWVGQSGDGLIGVAYEQADGESVWVLVDPLFGNNSQTPVSAVDISVDDLLAYVSDDRLGVLDADGTELCPGDDGIGPPWDCPSPTSNG